MTFINFFTQIQFFLEKYFIINNTVFFTNIDLFFIFKEVPYFNFSLLYYFKIFFVFLAIDFLLFIFWVLIWLLPYFNKKIYKNDNLFFIYWKFIPFFWTFFTFLWWLFLDDIKKMYFLKIFIWNILLFLFCSFFWFLVYFFYNL